MKNNRTFLEKLLDGAEVEWKPLKDILIRTKGTKITAAEMKVLHKDNAPLKIFAGGKTFALVNFEDIPEKDINKNPSIIVKSRGIIEFEYYDKPFSHKNEMWSYYSNDKNINIKYIYYILENQEPYFQNLGSKMQMPQIATPDTDKYLVPIPPLSVQTKIVKILDALTALTSELTSELILRRKQYEYYREKLLNIDGVNKVIELGDVGPVRMCKRILKNQTESSGDIPFYKIGTFGKKPDAYISNELFKNINKNIAILKKEIFLYLLAELLVEQLYLMVKILIFKIAISSGSIMMKLSSLINIYTISIKLLNGELPKEAPFNVYITTI